MKTTLRLLFVSLALALALFTSCSQYQDQNGPQSAVYSSAPEARVGRSDQPASGVLERAPAEGIQDVPPPVLEQKIIYTATIHLQTRDFDSFPAELARVTAEFGGFAAESNVARMQGQQRSGRWVVRVPGSRYHDFIHTLSGLGIPESVQEKADEVTDQFMDLQARISSGRRLEEQIIKLLEKQDDKIENVLAVEKELARVRLEIEQMEGHLRLLEDKVAMSTVTIHASEQRTYVPDQAMTLGQRIELNWLNAVERLQNFFTYTLLLVVANAFVIPVWIAAIGLVWFCVVRPLRKKIRQASQAPVDPDEA